MTARILRLVRSASGPTTTTSQTGVVAEAVVFSDGPAVLHWLTDPAGTEIYPSEAAMRQVREASGRSAFEDQPFFDLPPEVADWIRKLLWSRHPPRSRSPRI